MAQQPTQLPVDNSEKKASSSTSGDSTAESSGERLTLPPSDRYVIIVDDPDAEYIAVNETDIYFVLDPEDPISGQRVAELIAQELGTTAARRLTHHASQGGWRELIQDIPDQNIKRAILYMYAREHPDDPTLIRCPFCGKYFLTERGRLMHKISCHPLEGLILH